MSATPPKGQPVPLPGPSEPPVSDVKTAGSTRSAPAGAGPSDVGPTRERTSCVERRGASSQPPSDLDPDLRLVPAARLDGLVHLAATLPLEGGVRAVAEALCETVQDSFPHLVVAVVVAGEGKDGGPLVVATTVPASTSGSPVAPGVPTRVFPSPTEEWVVTLPVPFEGASVHVGRASDSGNARDGAPRDVAERAAITLAAALRAIREQRAGRGDGSQIRELQARVLHTEKLASVGQIAAKVVHELNNPLTAIVTYAEFLTRKLERADHDPGDVERLRRIAESAERILRFSRDLTTYARPHETPAPLSISEVLERAILFCDHVLADASVQVSTRVDPETPPLHGLRGQLTQVFVNLITNACHAIQDAGREGGVIELVAEPVEQGAVRISVGDNGNGISPEAVVRIFDPFYTTKSEGRGTGLGLSIVRSIVEGHGGRVWVRSVLGSGSQFVVELGSRR